MRFPADQRQMGPVSVVSSVDKGTAADDAGLRPGDCLLEVNGEDIVGKRISEIAEIVKSSHARQVSLLLWNAGVDPQCTPEVICRIRSERRKYCVIPMKYIQVSQNDRNCI